MFLTELRHSLHTLRTLRPTALLPRLSCHSLHASRGPAISSVLEQTVSAELEHIVSTYQDLCRRIDCFASRNPKIAGVSTLQQRAKRDLQHVSLHGGKYLTCIKNNAIGMNAELDVAESAPGVVGVSQRFRLAPPYAGSAPTAVLACAGPAVFPSASRTVEVDVVAAGGSLWIEVKAHQSFGAGSRRASDMERQAELQVRAARAPWNAWQWRPPLDVYHSTLAPWAPEVAERLRARGVLVAGPGPLGPEIMDSLPPPPDAANLDITTLCSLVSELSHGAAHDTDADVQAALATRWFTLCAEAERAAPLLAELRPALEGRLLVAAAAAVEHFESLLAAHGGPREHARWAGMRGTLRVMPDQPAKQLGRVRALEGLESHQRAVLGVAETLRAVTLSANGRLFARAAAQGVRLPVRVHRSHFLLGR